MFKIIPQKFILKVTPVDRIKCDSFNVNPFASVHNKIAPFGTCHTHLSLDLAIVAMVPFKSTLCVTYLLHNEIWGHVELGIYENISPQLNQNK